MKKKIIPRLVQSIALLALLVILMLYVGPVQSPSCAAGECNAYSSSCTSHCCFGVRISNHVLSCTVISRSYCQKNWDAGTNEYCPAGGCAVTVNQKTCTFVAASKTCRLDNYYIADGCCITNPNPPTKTPPPPPTATHLPPTSTRTATAVPPTATSTRTPTSTPVPVLTTNLTAAYSSLVLNGPALGLPAQTLNGTITGGSLPYSVTMYVTRPSGTVTYSFNPGTTFSFGTSESGDTNFGVSQLGTWRAWFTVSAGAQTATSNTVTWTVNWYPVHQIP